MKTADPPLVGALLALFAHDFRNPLSAARSNLGFLQTAIPESDRDGHEALADVSVSCDSLLTIIDNLELFGRLLRDEEAHLAQLSAWDLTQGVVQQMQPLAESHGCSLVLEPGVQDAGLIEADRNALSCALVNFIRNGIQHGGSGKEVRVGVSRDGEQVVVRIEDAGARVADEQWEGASSADGQLTAKRSGSARYGYGLGLFVARRAAELAGAELRRPSQDQGNVIELRFTRAS